MWQALAAVLTVVFSNSLKGIVARVLLALGLGVVTVTGLNALLQAGIAQANISAVGDTQFQAAITAMGIPWFISTLLSAFTTRLTLRGLSSDAFSFFVLRRGLPSV